MTDNKKVEKYKRLSIMLPIERHIEIKMAASAANKSIKDLIEDALYHYGSCQQKGEFDEN